MKVLVDTSIWSLAFRRKNLKPDEAKIVERLIDLIDENRVEIIGAIRQEILSGISSEASYLQLRDRLRAFLDLDVITSVFEQAAEMANSCRKKGIQGSHTDFLICAVAEQYHLSIFTTDRDFHHYAKYVPIRLLDF